MTPTHRFRMLHPPGVQAHVEEIIDRFEEAWRAPGPPHIEAFLPADETLFRPVLVELVHVDLEHRLKRREAVGVTAYLRRYPELADDRGTLVELLAAEFEQRRRREPRLTLEEFLRRVISGPN